MTCKVAVVGSGYMGGGIAHILALSGFKGALADVSAEVAENNYQRLIRESMDFIEEGLFPEHATETLDQNLSAAGSVEEAVVHADFIDEAVPEVLKIKNDIPARISEAGRHHRLQHLHDFHRRDVHGRAETGTVPRRALFQSIAIHPRRRNHPPRKHGESDGGCRTGDGSRHRQGNRRRQGSHRVCAQPAAVRAVPRGNAAGGKGVADPEDIDTLVRTTFGFRLPFFGPFAIADMAGLDVYNFCYKSLQTDFPERFATPKILSDLVEAGKLGTKSGAGFLDVPSDRTPELIAYRNKAYVAMQKLIEDLGPAPLN